MKTKNKPAGLKYNYFILTLLFLINGFYSFSQYNYCPAFPGGFTTCTQSGTAVKIADIQIIAQNYTGLCNPVICTAADGLWNCSTQYSKVACNLFGGATYFYGGEAVDFKGYNTGVSPVTSYFGIYFDLNSDGCYDDVEISSLTGCSYINPCGPEGVAYGGVSGTSGNWSSLLNFSLPSCTANVNVNMRIINQSTSFVADDGSGANAITVNDYTLGLLNNNSSGTLSLSSIDATYPQGTDCVNLNTTKRLMMKVQVVTDLSGSSEACGVLEHIQLYYNGANYSTNINQVQLWYSGSDDVFDPNGVSFPSGPVTGTQSGNVLTFSSLNIYLLAVRNYFWVTFDIKNTGNLTDVTGVEFRNQGATCNSTTDRITIDATDYTNNGSSCGGALIANSTPSTGYRTITNTSCPSYRFGNTQSNLNPDLPVHQNHFRAYPNPFSTNFHFEYLNELDPLVSVEIVDLIGKSVRVLKKNGNTVTEFKIIEDLSNLPGGIYLLKVKTKNREFSQKLTGLN